jgi:hypothetical protein
VLPSGYTDHGGHRRPGGPPGGVDRPNLIRYVLYGAAAGFDERLRETTTIMIGDKFVADAITRIRSDGREGVAETFYRIYQVLWKRVDLLYGRRGTDVYDREWDVLIVLDGCRADLMAAAAAEYDFVTRVGSVRSTASKTKDWLHRTFGPDRRRETAGTAYVGGNPFSSACLDSAAFALLDEVWADAWDDDLGTIPAPPITDRAIGHWRSGEYDRMIVHYMQPHFPSVPNPDLGSGLRRDLFGTGDAWDSIWDRLRKGEVSEAAVRTAYRENLEHVLDSVSLLVDSIDAERVVITADHGNSFGSWGLYGHPRAPIAALREVPWCELAAQDVSGYEPETTAGQDVIHEPTAEGVESKLRDLGYL